MAHLCLSIVGRFYVRNQSGMPIWNAQKQRKKKKKGQPCIIDLEDELNNFLDAQKTANEGRKEMLETQRRVSSENLEARRLAHLAAKEHKESVILETYRALLMKETTGMPEDVKSEHVLALKCLREKLFNILSTINQSWQNSEICMFLCPFPITLVINMVSCF